MIQKQSKVGIIGLNPSKAKTRQNHNPDGLFKNHFAISHSLFISQCRPSPLALSPCLPSPSRPFSSPFHVNPRPSPCRPSPCRLVSPLLVALSPCLPSPCPLVPLSPCPTTPAPPLPAQKPHLSGYSLLSVYRVRLAVQDGFFRFPSYS
jgi:hypothetical protein